MASVNAAKFILLLTLVVATVTVSVIPVHAHDRTTSYSSWYLSQRQAKVILRMNEVDLTTISWAARKSSSFDAELARYAVENLVMLAGKQVCKVIEKPHETKELAGRLTLRWSVSCPGKGLLKIHSDLLFNTRSTHLHFVSLHHEETIADRVLSDTERS